MISFLNQFDLFEIGMGTLFICVLDTLFFIWFLRRPQNSTSLTQISKNNLTPASYQNTSSPQATPLSENSAPRLLKRKTPVDTPLSSEAMVTPPESSPSIPPVESPTASPQTPVYKTQGPPPINPTTFAHPMGTRPLRRKNIPFAGITRTLNPPTVPTPISPPPVVNKQVEPPAPVVNKQVVTPAPVVNKPAGPLNAIPPLNSFDDIPLTGTRPLRRRNIEVTDPSKQVPTPISSNFPQVNKDQISPRPPGASIPSTRLTQKKLSTEPPTKKTAIIYSTKIIGTAGAHRPPISSAPNAPSSSNLPPINPSSGGKGMAQSRFFQTKEFSSLRIRNPRPESSPTTSPSLSSSPKIEENSSLPPIEPAPSEQKDKEI